MYECFLVVALVMFSCTVSRQGNSYVDFIGGKKAEAKQFSSTVIIYFRGGSCGSAKVGKGVLLTAAHCVIGNIASGDVIDVQLRTGKVEPVARYIKIIKTAIHPTYKAAIDSGSSLGEASNQAPDIGLLWVEDPLAEIPSAEIDFAPVTVGTEVIVSGSGCAQDDITPATTFAPKTLKYIQHTVEGIEASYFTFPRFDSDGVEGRVCPGDSGTPVYLNSVTRLKIVGINSFRHPTHQVWSAATRIDELATGNPERWVLEQLASN
jgi:secreted trypsin-like serine protease